MEVRVVMRAVGMRSRLPSLELFAFVKLSLPLSSFNLT